MTELDAAQYPLQPMQCNLYILLCIRYPRQQMQSAYNINLQSIASQYKQKSQTKIDYRNPQFTSTPQATFTSTSNNQPAGHCIVASVVSCFCNCISTRSSKCHVITKVRDREYIDSFVYYYLFFVINNNTTPQLLTTKIFCPIPTSWLSLIVVKS